jgi:predicted TPR repeat methyltransferase
MVKKFIEQYNDKLSSVYDKASKGEFAWTPPKELKKLIKQHLKKDLNVLDIGVGTGQTAKIFINSGASVTGLDISQKMLASAGSKLKFKELIRHDIEKGLPSELKKEKFDIIVACGILEFVRDIEKVLKDIKKLLKPNGLIVFTYEVFGEKNPYELKKTAPLGEGIKPEIPKLMRFKVYRRTPMEINKIVEKMMLKVYKRKIFTSYLKSSQKTPVIYEIILAGQ